MQNMCVEYFDESASPRGMSLDFAFGFRLHMDSIFSSVLYLQRKKSTFVSSKTSKHVQNQWIKVGKPPYVIETWKKQLKT